jgi:hypothetical protein
MTDPSIISVWNHPRIPVHIQFVKSAELKWEIQNLLKDKHILPLRREHKDMEKAVWRAAWLCLEVNNSLIVSQLLKEFKK